jgi:hypothetical protein
MTGPAIEAKQPWWQRHRALAIGVVVLVIAAITVLTDLPVGTTRSSDLNAERSVMSEVNSDLAPCALAVRQAIGIWTLQSAHQLSGPDRAPTPGLLSDDQAACSLAGEGVYDLSDIEVPQTAAGKHIGELVATTLLWTTSDALRAIEDVQTLMNHPNDAAVLADLTKQEARLANDRATAIAQEEAADRVLGTRLRPVDLPVVKSTASGSAGSQGSG